MKTTTFATMRCSNNGNSNNKFIKKGKIFLFSLGCFLFVLFFNCLFEFEVQIFHRILCLFLSETKYHVAKTFVRKGTDWIRLAKWKRRKILISESKHGSVCDRCLQSKKKTNSIDYYNCKMKGKTFKKLPKILPLVYNPFLLHLDWFHSWISERFVIPCLKKTKTFHCYAWLRLNHIHRTDCPKYSKFQLTISHKLLETFLSINLHLWRIKNLLNWDIFWVIFSWDCTEILVSLAFLRITQLIIFVIATKWTARECCIYVGWCMKAGQRHTASNRKEKRLW